MDLSQRTTLIFACLGHPYRRKTVNIVTERSEPITIDELAREIATRSDSGRSGEHNSNPVERIRVELYHGHLPKLAETDLIEYDPETNLVSSTPVTPHLTDLVKIAYSIAEVM